MTENPIVIMGAAQCLMLLVYRWVANNYYLRPRHDHPMIFWSPIGRFFLCTLPTLVMVGLVITAFWMATHPWWFLAGTVVGILIVVPNPNKTDPR